MDNSNVIYFDSIPSTNAYASEHFDELPDGTLVCAGTQTAGRGRLGRKWISAEGGLFASYVMKQLNPKNVFQSTICGSLAALRLMREACPEGNFYIKWPNDVYSRHRKAAGLLSECVLRNGAPAGVIVGIGINVNVTEETLSASGMAAVSMSILSGRTFSLEKMRNGLEKTLKECYILYLRAPDVLFTSWLNENRLIGHQLAFRVPDGSVIRGTFQGIAPDGEAIVFDGIREHKLGCGDATVLKENWDI